MLVTQKQFPAVAEIAVYYIDPRFSEVRQADEQPLLDFLEVAGLNDVLPPLFLPGERAYYDLETLWAASEKRRVTKSSSTAR